MLQAVDAGRETAEGGGVKAVTAAAIVGLLAIGALSAAIILQPGGAPAPATQSEKDRAIIRGAGLEAETDKRVASEALPPVCQKYVDAFHSCFGGGDSSDATGNDTFEKLVMSWTELARQGQGDLLVPGCRQLASSARSNFGGMCPSVQWE